MVAATHGLLLPGAREKLDHPAVRQVFVTDSVCVAKKDWPRLHVISIAPLIARALEMFLADGSLDERFEETSRSALQGETLHGASILS
jgi:ribose-phosphate pyrophosphokinase